MRQQQQPAYAEPVPGLLLVRGAEDLQPDRRALVDQRREAAHLVPGAALVNDSSMVPNVHDVWPVAREPGVGGDLGHRLRELAAAAAP